MVFATITAVGGFVVFFLYHRIMVTKFEKSLANFEAELDYIEDVLQSVRLKYIELEKMMIPRSYVKRSYVKKAPKKNVGRPTNPDSARQKKLNGGK